MKAGTSLKGEAGMTELLRTIRETISSEELFFFDRKPAALPMYEVFRKSVLAEIRN